MSLSVKREYKQHDGKCESCSGHCETSPLAARPVLGDQHFLIPNDCGMPWRRAPNQAVLPDLHRVRRLDIPAAMEVSRWSRWMDRFQPRNRRRFSRCNCRSLRSELTCPNMSSWYQRMNSAVDTTCCCRLSDRCHSRRSDRLWTQAHSNSAAPGVARPSRSGRSSRCPWLKSCW